MAWCVLPACLSGSFYYLLPFTPLVWPLPSPDFFMLGKMLFCLPPRRLYQGKTTRVVIEHMMIIIRLSSFSILLWTCSGQNKDLLKIYLTLSSRGCQRASVSGSLSWVSSLSSFKPQKGQTVYFTGALPSYIFWYVRRVCVCFDKMTTWVYLHFLHK